MNDNWRYQDDAPEGWQFIGEADQSIGSDVGSDWLDESGNLLLVPMWDECEYCSGNGYDPTMCDDGDLYEPLDEDDEEDAVTVDDLIQDFPCPLCGGSGRTELPKFRFDDAVSKGQYLKVQQLTVNGRGSIGGVEWWVKP